MFMNEKNSVLNIDIASTIERMFEHLFSANDEIVISFSFNQGLLYVFRNGEELDDLEHLIKSYNVVKTYPHFKFSNYDEMLEIIEDQQLCVDIDPELYKWTRR